MLLAAACIACVFAAAEPEVAITPPPVTGPRVEKQLFCETYVPQIQTNKDFDRLKKLPDPMRSRIRDNEVNYLCDCLHWDNELCKSTGQ